MNQTNTIKTGYIYVSSFTEADLKSFTEKFLELEASPKLGIIILFISSYGGSVHNFLSMRDLIKSSSKKVVTVALGKAMSAGAFLLNSGTKGYRFVAPTASVMLHEISGGAIGTNTQIQVDAKETARLNDLIVEVVAEDSGLSVGRVRAILSQGDTYLTAQEAIQVGLADHIGVPRTIASGIQEINLAILNQAMEPEKPARTSRRKRKK